MEPAPDPGWHVVIPVKGGPTAKSRLRHSLDDGAVVAAVAHDTLDVAGQVVGPARVVVVTSEPSETAYARSSGHLVVADPGTGLDDACAAGVAAAHAAGAVRVAVLLGDHPALRPAELESTLRAGELHPTFFVADADGTGTALVGATGGHSPTLAFGPGSAARHRDLGHAPLEVDAPGLRHDVDDEESLRWALAHLTLGPRTRAALER
ncbi:2-phospho-L-lactate guanylyltransferase [Knoellia locipacati]|uniref:2-phospho-L-lactate guanylyltransferase n=1 Tax=Knoellia locipacati TaxID=882824 RepID=A0A512SVZ5_9MICO|nr:2-phospho-L-lactate guanylyltransferase [Knoellia locipacati]GEQ12131.1 2-phospho-L-lactate guanylyltransferase [Knoellia locipacati]